MTGDDLKATRLALGLTRAELGSKLGVAMTTVFRWETGSRRIRPMAAGLIRRVTGELARRRRQKRSKT